MICPKCRTMNENANLFCVNCGETFSSSSDMSQTIILPQNPSQPMMPTQNFSSFPNQTSDYQSEPTVFSPNPNFNPSQANYNASQAGFNPSQANFNPSMSGFNPSLPYIPPQPQRKSRMGLWLGLGVLLALLIGGGIIAAVLLMNRATNSAEVLPGYLGLFFQNSDKTSVNEIKKRDFANAIEGKDKILKDDSLPALEEKPNLILYSDGKDIPLNDLKLIQLDTVKTDGTMKQIDFKATPVEGKPEMKRLWFPEGLANGKYAFVLIDGFFDDGKHKFWAFEVKNAAKTDNANLTKETSVSVKNKSNSTNSTTKTETNSTTTTVTNTAPTTPKPTIVAPVGSRTAYCNTNNVVVRAAPNLNAQKVSGLRRGQKIYVLGYSSNYDYWRGLEGNWVNIQTESGQRGWVFSPFVSY